MRASLSFALLLLSSPVYSATIVVDSNSASNNVAGACTVRDAITAANTDAATGGCIAGSGNDTIALPIGASITLTDIDNTTHFGTGLPAITSTIYLIGNRTTIARDTAATCNYLADGPGPGKMRFFVVAASGDLTLDNLVLTNGCSTSDGSEISSGGSIYNSGHLILHSVKISGSFSGVGAAIFSDGDLVVDRSTFDANTYTGYGGAIADSSGAHNTLIEHSAFTNNAVEGFPVRGEGGAIYHDTGTLTIRNSTFANNSAYQGGALRLHAGPTLISNSTFYDNDSGASGPPDGSISSATAGSQVLKVTNTIIVSNPLLASCHLPSGYLAAIGNNLSSDASCTGFTFTNADPQISVLSSGSDAPPYFPLPASSPAIDGALTCLDASGLSTIVDDQRGRARPYGSSCDLGAYERDDLLFANGFEP
jgi:hypothetical protein